MRVELARLHQKLKSTIVYVTHDQTEAMTLGQRIVLLNEGTVQQIGTPADLYERPANLFVAGFIGVPQINLFDGTVKDIQGRLYFQSDVLKVDVGSWQELKQYEGKDITVAIRPESFSLGDGPINGVIELVERLGSETILYVIVGDKRIIARVISDEGKDNGHKVSFTLSNKGIHFFHDNKRIARQ
jgi:ABC-type sugar transport system ATPase subunit